MKKIRPHSPDSTRPIVVLADDLTGAAELAGAAREHGLTAEVQTRFQPAARADVLALDTDTRWRGPEDAARVVAEAARAVFSAQPAWVYKKTDSVLRGNARVEIECIAAAVGLPGALLVPANPSRGRVIRGGDYFVQGVPLDETAFARDPEHPRTTARVAELLGASRLIRVPDTVDRADLAAHADAVDVRTLPAGGVDFFKALLAARGHRVADAPRGRLGRPPVPTVFVCGSAAAWQQGREELRTRLGAPCLLPPPAFWQRTADAAVLAGWAAEISSQLKTHGTLLVAIGPTPARLDSSQLPLPRELAARLAEAVGRAAVALERGRLCVEGGATARAVVDRLGWTRLELLREWATGVVEFHRAGGGPWTLVCKAGSYEWPEALLAELVPPAAPVAVPIEDALDLHTFRPEDLGVLLPEYLAQCRARGLREVRLIHGRGTGSVRRGVEALLGRLELVESFQPAGAFHGGPGATIVKLRAG